jgi:hypothetical protein
MRLDPDLANEARAAPVALVVPGICRFCPSCGRLARLCFGFEGAGGGSRYFSGRGGILAAVAGSISINLFAREK